jgi:hypothetical protein
MVGCVAGAPAGLCAFWACSERPRRRLGLINGNRLPRDGFGRLRRQHRPLALQSLHRAGRIKPGVSADQHEHLLKLGRAELGRDLVHAVLMQQQHSTDHVLRHTLCDGPAQPVGRKMKTEAIRHGVGIIFRQRARYTQSGHQAVPHADRYPHRPWRDFRFVGTQSSIWPITSLSPGVGPRKGLRGLWLPVPLSVYGGKPWNALRPKWRHRLPRTLGAKPPQGAVEAIPDV